MAAETLGEVLRRIGRSAGLQGVLSLTDAQLLERFVSRRDEPAFAALMVRHGPMVLGVCRRLLHDRTEAEDAFQAAFLVLARKAGAVQRRPLLAAWLYGVAYKVAARLRGRTWKRDAHEKPGADFASAAAPDPPEPQPELHDEVRRLPDIYRNPIILCYLEGKTHEEAATLLRWPVGTVKGRLARARDLLRSRLTRRGLALSEGVTATALAGAPATATPALVDATIRAATRFAAGDGGAGGLVSARAIALSQGVLRAMILTKVKILTASVLALALLAGVGSYVGWLRAGGPDDAPKAGARAADKPAPGDKANDDKEAIQGTWQVTGVEMQGKEAPDNAETKEMKSAKWVIAADKITVVMPKQGKHDASYQLDPTTKPKQLDFTPLDGPKNEKGKTGHGIYSLEGDVLKICMPMSPDADERPTVLATKEGGKAILLTLKREKPAKSEKPESDKEAIQGVWQVSDFEVKGVGPDEGDLKKIKAQKWVFTADKLVVRMPAKESKDSTASYKLDPSKTPKEIDVTPLDGPSKGTPQPGIYSLDGGVLKLCLPGPEGGPRPTKLAADEGGKTILLTLIREGVDANDK